MPPWAVMRPAARGGRFGGPGGAAFACGVAVDGGTAVISRVRFSRLGGGGGSLRFFTGAPPAGVAAAFGAGGGFDRSVLPAGGTLPRPTEMARICWL